MRYRGPLKAAILDWAGTSVDFGSFAPVAVLMDVFSACSVPITAAEARANMGLLKKDHIRAICEQPAVRGRWTSIHGGAPGECDVERLFADFVPRQISTLENHSDVIPGVVEAVSRMRERGLRIASTTGYTRPMLDVVIGRARAQGYEPDVALCPDDVGAGRPLPWMCFEAAKRLGVYPPCAIVKIGDTPVDIEEGLNAGMWTVGVTATGNEVGLTEKDFEALAPGDRDRLVGRARIRLLNAGAHYVVDSVAQCDAALAEIERAIHKAEAP